MIKKITLAVTVILIIGCLMSFMSFGHLKVVYVNTYSVYNEFKLKKELEDKLKRTQLTRKVLLDSLRVKIQMASIKLDRSDDRTFYAQLDKMKEGYYTKEKQYAEDNALQSQQYTDEVWKQLNQYIKDFGSEKGYDYIIGANGEGNLMYAKEQNDVSKELIQFVNEKYAGK